MGVSVGIDLGTTFSAVAIVDPKNNEPKIVLNAEGEKITPSVIQFQKDYKTENVITIVGSEAKDAFEMGEDGCVSAFKRLMGTDKEYYRFDGKSYTSVDLSAILLKYLKDGAEHTLGDTIDEAVITVPAYFYSAEREATICAARMAGIKVKKIIDEPNAAVMAFGLNHWRNNANILVYDLGGGTFDVTLTHMENNGLLQTIVTRGDHVLGGKDWDARVLGIVKSRIQEETGFEVDSDMDFAKEVMGIAEGLKKKLTISDKASVNINIPGYGIYPVKITLDEFDSSTADLLNKTGGLCQNVLDEAGMTWSDVTDILLVGGSTRMRQVPRYLEKISNGLKPLSQVNPDEAVALGAAIQSSKKNEGYASLSVQVVDGKKVTDRSKQGLNLNETVESEKKLSGLEMLSLCETTAHALGIIALSDDGRKYINDTIIPANHPRPVKVAKAFYVNTEPNDNNEMEIFVLQGDSEKILDNQIPYRYIVSGINHSLGRNGNTKIRVQYSYDNNGVINVEARQESEDVNLPIRREVVPDDMSQFERAVENNVKLKANRNNTNSVGVYSQWAGISNIPSTSLDRFGNPEGSQYDLVSDGTFEGDKILIINLCAGATMNGAIEALKSKGFSVDLVVGYAPEPKELRNRLLDKCQLWIISQAALHFNDEHCKYIKEFFDAGHGIYIWGDNDPLNTSSNYILERLFGSKLSGDYHARQILSIQKGKGEPGILENHLISTGIVSFFEGDSIAQVHMNKNIKPLIYSSDKNVVTAYWDEEQKRALIDGAFTRLWDRDWGNCAGTARYIVNAAAWLANVERFSKKFIKKDSDIPDDRNVDTWD